MKRKRFGINACVKSSVEQFDVEIHEHDFA